MNNECNICGVFFGRFQIVNGIRHDVHNRKSCLDCVPLGKRVYPTKVGTMCICLSCEKQYVYAKNIGASTTKCRICYGIKARHELKKKAIEYKGGCCILCGYDKSQSALEFHHINPKEKEFQIGGNHTRAWKKIQQELDKCELLCANCHRETHDNGM